MSKEKWVAIEDTINLIDDHIEIRNCCAEYVCKELNEKTHRIAELEEQLKNAIILPIPIGEKCWTINCWKEYGDAKKGEPYSVTRYALHENTVSVYEIYKSMINNELTLQIIPRCKTNYYGITSYVFATKEEAESKLEELKGE